jgi:hypothetical protein
MDIYSSYLLYYRAFFFSFCWFALRDLHSMERGTSTSAVGVLQGQNPVNNEFSLLLTQALSHGHYICTPYYDALFKSQPNVYICTL